MTYQNMETHEDGDMSSGVLSKYCTEYISD